MYFLRFTFTATFPRSIAQNHGPEYQIEDEERDGKHQSTLLIDPIGHFLRSHGRPFLGFPRLGFFDAIRFWYLYRRGTVFFL